MSQTVEMASNLQVSFFDLKVRHRGVSIQQFRSNLQVIYQFTEGWADFARKGGNLL